jgi:hypothetical protein
MSIVSDPPDEDEQYQMSSTYSFEERYPFATAVAYFTLLLLIGMAVVFFL